MRYYLSFVTIALLLSACGGGGGTTSVDEDTPSIPAPSIDTDPRAEVSFDNGFKAYDIASVSSFTPSIILDIHQKISSEDGLYSCENGTTVKKSTIVNDTLVHIDEYNFDNCTLTINGSSNLLYGTAYIQTVNSQSGETLYIGLIEDGFRYQMLYSDKSIDLTYKKANYIDKAVIDGDSFVEAEGSGFEYSTYTYDDKNLSLLLNFSKFYETTLGDVSFTGMFANNTIPDSGVLGISLSPTSETAMFNYLYSADVENTDGKLEIYLNDTNYLDNDFSIDEAYDQNHIKLSGKNNQYLSVWQDDNEDVYVKIDDETRSSSITYTPSFFKLINFEY